MHIVLLYTVYILLYILYTYCYIYCIHTAIYTAIYILLYILLYILYTYCYIYCIHTAIHTAIYTAIYTVYSVITAIHLHHIPCLWHQILFIAVIPGVMLYLLLYLFIAVIYCVYQLFNSCLTVIHC